MSSAAARTDGFPELLGGTTQPWPSLWEFVQASGHGSLVMGASKIPNAKVTVLLVSTVSGEPVLAVKVPTTDTAARAVESEARVLVALHRAGTSVADTIPRVVELVEYDGRPGIVMTAAPGTPMSTSYLGWRHTAKPPRVAADFAAVARWLAEFQHMTSGEDVPLDMDAGVAARLSERFSDSEGLDADLERLAEIYARLRRNEVPRTAVHGDLWFANILLSAGRVSGVVDWEGGAASGEPVRDLVRFPLMYALFLDRRTRAGRGVAGHPGLRAGNWGAALEYAVDGSGWFPELFRRFLCEGLARLGASPLRWRDAALAGIAEVAAFTDHADFARSHLELFRRLAHGQADRGARRTS